MLIFCDNQFAIRLAENIMFHTKTKHGKYTITFLEKKVLLEEMEMCWVRIDDQAADVFIRELIFTKYQMFKKRVNGYNKIWWKWLMKGSVEDHHRL